MDQQIADLDEQMKEEIRLTRAKYATKRKQIRNSYKTNCPIKKKTQTIKKITRKKTIPKCLKNIVWNNNIGKEFGIGKCHVCQKEIDSKNFEAGHIVAEANGGDTSEYNLVPICGLCNRSMGTRNLDEFKKQYFNKDQMDVCN